jgi:hypothetical protein
MPLLLAFALAAQAQVPWFRVTPGQPCTIATAERVTFAQVQREATRLRHRCVAVRGIWSGRALYEGVAAARASRAPYDPATSHQPIGLYGSVAVERGRAEPDAWIIVGLLYDCTVFEGREIGGYCHSGRSGPFLAVTDMRRRTWPGPRGIW